MRDFPTGGTVVADYLHESAIEIYRRRRRQRAYFTMIFVVVVLFGSIGYASSYVQGWVGNAAAKPLDNVSCNGSTASQALGASDVTVNVYNSTGRIGLAGTTGAAMQKEGFSVAAIDNDPLGKKILGVGEIRHGPSGLEGAQLVAKRMPGAKIVLDDRTDATVDMVVGKKFRAVKVQPKPHASKKAAHC